MSLRQTGDGDRREPPWNDLDPGIREVVAELWGDGFETIASCQGHGTDDAWVALLPPPNVEVMGYLEQLDGWLLDHGWADHCILSFHQPLIPRGVVRWRPQRWVRITWWGGVPFR